MFTNQTIYITGASSGIGREFAVQLGAKGARLALFARRSRELDALAADLRSRGVPVHAECLDVTDNGALKVAFAAAEQAVGPCQVLIANAGVGYPVKATAFDAERAADIYRVNVFGALNAIAAVLPGMLERKEGHIVGLASLAAYRSFPESHTYCGSKSALKAQLEGMRLELLPQGVHVTTICPGFIRTEMTAGQKISMPLLLDCQAATRRMIKAIEEKRAVFNFPRRMYWLIQLSRFLPDALLTRLSTAPARKP